MPIRPNLARVIVALAVAVVFCIVVAPSALASHARPKSASPLSIKLVPASEECFGTSTGNHGPPLELASCSVIQSSSYLTMNAPERPAPYTGGASGTGSVSLKVTCVSSSNPLVETSDTPPCNANAGDQQDLKITTAATDVRCVGNPGPPAQALCAGGAGAAGAGSLYDGKVLVDMPMRITDHYNNLTASNPSCETAATPGTGGAPPPQCEGTMTDTVLLVGVQCINGACNYTTGADASIPAFAREFKRAVVELGQIQFQDAGANGTLAAAPTPASGVCPPACQQDDASFTVYLSQGLFIP